MFIYWIAGVILLILLIFQYSSYEWTVKKISQIEHHDTIKSYEAVVTTILKDGEKLLRSQVDTLAFDKRVIAALKIGNNSAIVNEFKDQFLILKEKNLVTHWYFYSAKKKVLARLHNPTVYGEVSLREGLELAIRTGRTQVEFSYGLVAKILTLRVFKPIYEGTRLLGALELGIDMSNLLSHRFGRVLPHKSDHVLLTSSASLDRDTWKNWEQPPTEADFDRIIADSQASEAELASIFRNLGDILKSEKGFFINNELIFQVINIKYNDRVNRDVGKIILVYPASTILPALQFSIFLISVTTGLMFVLLIYAFIRVFYSNQKILQHSFQQAKMSTLGEMAANIAHEINNPLAIISGKTQIIINQINSGNFDLIKLNSDLNKIVQTIGRIDRIVKGIKLISRSSESDVYEFVTIERVVQETLELCNERIYFHQIELRLKNSLKISIECRPTQIVQVLLNLVGNSIDAVGTKPIKWIEIEAVQQGESVVISVADSGAGIPESIQSRLAQPFFTTKDIGKGTGLGLSISKGIVENHGGTFKYDQTSLNTRFLMVLPLQQVKLRKLAA